MRKQSRMSILVLGVLCSSAVVQGQDALVTSDVAPLVGSWTLDTVKTSGATEPERRVITAGRGWMRVEVYRPSDDRAPVLIYNLDGSRNVNPFGSATATTEIRRDGADLVTVTVFTVNDRPVTVQERLRINEEGELTAAVLLRIEHGYEGVLPALEKRPANVSESLKYFRKSPPATP
jgi:hypothetical protein